MLESCEQASSSVEQASQGCQALAMITEKVRCITDMNNQIASAAEEQSAVTEEINRNLINISQVADQSGQGAKEAIAANAVLVDLTKRFESMARQFTL